MEDWDENKLEEVVNKKHGESEMAKPKTSIVSSAWVSRLHLLSYKLEEVVSKEPMEQVRRVFGDN